MRELSPEEFRCLDTLTIRRQPRRYPNASSSTPTGRHHALQKFDSEHHHAYEFVALATARLGY